MRGELRARLWSAFRRAMPIALGALLLTAHIGTNDAYYEGLAGPYAVRVAVRMPGVIPGQAQINVHVVQGDAKRVLVQVALWQVGRKGAPAPDVAENVVGAPNVFSAPLWLMTAGSYTVNVTVEGAQGTGTASVPVLAVATARLSMQRTLTWMLVVLGGALIAGLLTLVRAGLGESVVPPGELPDARRRRSGRVGIAVAAGVVALGLVGGNTWWNSVDRSYRRNMYRPLASRAELRPGVGGGAATLRFVLVDSGFFNARSTPLMPDHGKLMHLFAVREPTHDVLAHLHPTRVDSAAFETAFPGLPPGRYTIFADVVHESGFARTLVATTNVPAEPIDAAASTPGGGGAGDDAWLDSNANQGAATPGQAVSLGGGYSVTMDGGAPFIAGRDGSLRFTVRDAAGHVASLAPYMGMAAHAIVLRDDDSVFVHLHPMGTVSLAAQERQMRREAGDTVLHGADQPAMAMHAAQSYDGVVSFPFAFPKRGTYRVWIQTRPNGAVRTAAYDVMVR